jgi:hypothetical protein
MNLSGQSIPARPNATPSCTITHSPNVFTVMVPYKTDLIETRPRHWGKVTKVTLPGALRQYGRFAFSVQDLLRFISWSRRLRTFWRRNGALDADILFTPNYAAGLAKSSSKKGYSATISSSSSLCSRRAFRSSFITRRKTSGSWAATAWSHSWRMRRSRVTTRPMLE